MHTVEKVDAVAIDYLVFIMFEQRYLRVSFLKNTITAATVFNCQVFHLGRYVTNTDTII